MSADVNVLSQKLVDALERIGVTEDMRLKHREISLVGNIVTTLQNQITHSNLSDYTFGSYSEGSTCPGLQSDVDVVHCSDHFPLISDILDAPSSSVFLMVQGKETRPGYVKLQVVNNGVLYTSQNSSLESSLVTLDKHGNYCMKHLSLYGQLKHFKERNGPADTICNTPGVADTDNVAAFRCYTVPAFANKWMEPGRYGWPTRSMLERMKAQGCFVVGVGHPDSLERHLEWRLSFSLQERELMFSLNPIQHKCYVVLKFIKKDLIKPALGTSLSSYHCKTCLFHAVKHTKQNLWKPHNLLKCVTICLSILLKFLYHGYCPNFFVPEENMFERNIKGELRVQLIAKVRELIADGRIMLYSLQTDGIGETLATGICPPRSVAVELLSYKYRLDVRLLNAVHTAMAHIFDCLSKKTDLLTGLFEALSFIQTMPVLKDRSEDDTRQAVELMEPALCVMIAQCLCSQAFKYGEDHSVFPRFMQASEIYFELGRKFDVMLSRLVQVTVLYRHGKYEQCRLLLDEIVRDVKDCTISVCPCTARLHHFNEVLLKGIEAEEVIPLQTWRSVAVAKCVMFLPSDREIIPDALHHEMYRSQGMPPDSREEESEYWYDWAVVDAKVYLFFMQYLVHSRLCQASHRQTAIENLKQVIDTDRNLGHRETAYNLLGWIHVQEKRWKEANCCFTVSLKIQPAHNAAKQHLIHLEHVMRHCDGDNLSV